MVHNVWNARRTAAVIITYNDEYWLGPCLEALRRSSLTPDVYVLDNASSDGSPGIVRQYTEVELLQSPTNLGFAAGVNLVVGMIASDYEFLLLLNPDTRVERHAVRTLVEFLSERPEYAVVGPLQFAYDDSWDVLNEWCNRMLRSPGVNYMAQWVARLRQSTESRWQGVAFDCSYVQGAALLCRMDTFVRLRGLNENYWMFHEEVDFCRRVRWMGYRVGLVTTAQVQHHSRDISTRSWARVYYRRRNRYYYVLTEPSIGLTEAFHVCSRFLLRDLHRAVAEAAEGDFLELSALSLSALWLAFNVRLLARERRANSQAYLRASID